MPNVKVVNMAGKEVGEIALNDAVFAVEVNDAVIHSAVRAYLMNQRQGTQSTLTRTEVSVAVESLGDRRDPVVQDRVQQDLLNGHTVT